MADDDEWRVVMAWRAEGFTVKEFLDAAGRCYDYDQDFRLTSGELGPCPAGWEAVWEDHRRKRQAIREGLDQGYFPFQMVNAVGLGSTASDDDVEELKTANRRQHDSIVRQAATITGMQAALEDINKVPDETRRQLLSQARAELERARARKRRRWWLR